MNCSLLDVEFCHDKPGSTCPRTGSKEPAPHKPEGRDPDHQDCDSTLDHRDAEQGIWEVPSPREEGSGMKPLWPTSIPPAYVEKGQGAGAMSKPANHKVERAHCSTRATHAQHTRTPLHPVALASVPYGVVLVRVRVCSVEHPGLLMIAAPGHARNLLQ